MRLRKLVPFVSLIVVLLVAACAPATPVIPQTGPNTQRATATPGVGQTFTPGDVTDGQGTGTGDVGDDQGDATGGNTAPSPTGSQDVLDDNLRDRVAGFLSQQTSVNAMDVEVVNAQYVDFPNGCLGVPEQGEVCTQAITPGWQIIARADGELYVVHSNTDGSNIRWDSTADPESLMGTGTSGSQDGSTTNDQGGTTGGQTGGTTGGDTGGNAGGNGGANQGGGADGGGLRVSLDQVINIAAQFLGQTLNVPLNDIRLTSITVETWPDSCLGLGGTNCAQVTTPGYRLVLTAGGSTYELRTDNTGSTIRLVQGVNP